MNHLLPRQRDLSMCCIVMQVSQDLVYDSHDDIRVYIYSYGVSQYVLSLKVSSQEQGREI